MTIETIVRPLSERSTFQASQQQRRDNELQFEVTANVLDLPTGSCRAEADAVHVFATDIDVLAAWLYEKRGHVTTHDTGYGVTVWTLHTTAGADPGVVGCRVLVSVPLVSGEPVMQEIRDVVMERQFAVAIGADERKWMRFRAREGAVACAESYGLGVDYVREVLVDAA